MVMRIRKTNAILGTALIIGVLMMIYLVIDTISYEDLDAQKEELNGLEIKLRSLENDLLVNKKTIDLIKGQKISKANCGDLNSSKKQTKFTKREYVDAQDSEFCSFFGRIENTINCF